MRWKEKLWFQKSHCQWLKGVEKNTSFFHNMVKHRRRCSSIQAVKDDSGNWLHDINDIQALGIYFFRKLFTSEGCLLGDALLDYIPCLISLEDFSVITKIPDMDEILEALRSMPITASASPDGFSLSFYLAAWDVLCNGSARSPD